MALENLVTESSTRRLFSNSAKIIIKRKYVSSWLYPYESIGISHKNLLHKSLRGGLNGCFLVQRRDICGFLSQCSHLNMLNLL